MQDGVKKYIVANEQLHSPHGASNLFFSSTTRREHRQTKCRVPKLAPILNAHMRINLICALTMNAKLRGKIVGAVECWPKKKWDENSCNYSSAQIENKQKQAACNCSAVPC
jgi:hypothetical protein